MAIFQGIVQKEHGYAALMYLEGARRRVYGSDGAQWVADPRLVEMSPEKILANYQSMKPDDPARPAYSNAITALDIAGLTPRSFSPSADIAATPVKPWTQKFEPG